MALVADARGYSAWTAMTTTRLAVEGSPDPDGVGAIREFGTGSIHSREEVTAFEPPHHLAYRLLSGLPIEDYSADVHLTDVDGHRTRISWVGTYRSKGATGALMQRFLTFVLGDFVRRLKKEAAKRA